MANGIHMQCRAGRLQLRSNRQGYGYDGYDTLQQSWVDNGDGSVIIPSPGRIRMEIWKLKEEE